MQKKKEEAENKQRVNQGQPTQVQSVEISKVITDGQMVRTAQDDDYIIELSISIMQHGLLQPIVVKPLPDGNYQLQAGFHRLSAAKKLKWKTIPANIREDDTGSTTDIALIENIIRRNMTLDEESKAVCIMNLKEGKSISAICDLLGKSTAWVQKRLMIPNLPQEVMDELFDGKISIGHAEIVGRIEDQGTRSQILNIILQQRLTVRQTEDLAQMYFNSPSIGLAIEAGVKAAEEIQGASRVPTRTCDFCNGKTDLVKMRLVCICPACNDWVINKIQEEVEKEAANGKRSEQTAS